MLLFHVSVHFLLHWHVSPLDEFTNRSFTPFECISLQYYKFNPVIKLTFKKKKKKNGKSTQKDLENLRTLEANFDTCVPTRCP